MMDEVDKVDRVDGWSKRRSIWVWLLCILAGFGLMTPAWAAAGDEHPSKSAAWISPVDRGDLRRLDALGADIDGVWGDRARIYAADATLDAIRELGFTVSPISDGRRARTADGYPTVDEIGAELAELAEQHADICRLVSIGQTPGGRDLWMVRISDHPDAEEDEPEALYIGGIHGDEKPSTALCLELIGHLLENYGATPDITALVNDLEIWVLPVMNPDGYAANSRYTARWDDLNRSFPDRIDDPINTTFGRPLETRHLMNWVFGHSPALSISFHTGALLVNYPFDADPDPLAQYAESPDDDLFIAQSLAYAAQNPLMFQRNDYPEGIENGIINGLVWYEIHGGMQDWLYVWHGCNQLTVEVSDVKAPPFSEMAGLWNDNRDAMLDYLAWGRRGVRGRVTDSRTGEPLAATVRAAGIDHDVYTDPDVGDYHRMLLPGVYDLEIRADGYYAETVADIAVGEGPAARKDVALDPVAKGDVDGDRDIDLADAIRALQVAAGIDADGVQRHADVDGDGRIGVEEALFSLSAIQ